MGNNLRINTKKNILKKFTGKIALIIYSVFLSVLVWFIVSVTIYPTAPKTIDNVKLSNITLTGELANLSVVSPLPANADVQIRGERQQVGSIKADDLSVRVICDEVTGAGEYNLRLALDNHSGIEVETLKIEPANVNVTFDKIIEKRFDVTVEAPGVTVSEPDLFIDSTSISPQTVTIKGPAAQISSIDKVVVNVEDIISSAESYTTHASKMTLYTADESVLNQSSLTVPLMDYTVNFLILAKKTLKFDFELKNAPDYLDVDLLKSKFRFSPASITVAAPKDSINTFSRSLGYIDLREVTPEFVKVFYLTLPDNFKNISDIKSVGVIFDDQEYIQKDFTVNTEDFSIINKPMNYEFKIEEYSKTFSIIGPEESLEKIQPEDITVEVDLTDQNMTNLAFTKNYKVILENFPDCWASIEVENNTVTITATPVEAVSVDYLPFRF
ncbi:MAG: hypothetical protein LBM93_06795 [Oscillospiraceae bacterium]|jgi:YbbR domain-containing protein|nr:hypothetical protein [Oscillospiraceae bacterium]